MSTFVQLVMVGAGGCAGSVLRYGLSGLAQRLVPDAGFPLGTLVVNVLGCLAIGLLFGLGEARQLFGPQARLFLLVGVLGGFTTFSTFGWETVVLLRDGAVPRAAASVALHLVLGFGGVWLGYALGRGL